MNEACCTQAVTMNRSKKMRIPALATAVCVLLPATSSWAQATAAFYQGTEEKKTKVSTPVGIDIVQMTQKTQTTSKGSDQLIKGGAQAITINDQGVKEGILAAAINDFATTLPTPPLGLASLTDGFRIFNYSMSQAAAAKLNVILGGASGSADKKVFVYDFMFYKDDVDKGGVPITWGAGVRLVIVAKTIAATANVSSLPAIAASAQFNLIEASYNLQTVGMSGPKIVTAVPNAGSYDVEKHVELLRAIDAIRDAANDKTTVVTPKLIKLDVREDDTYIEAVARTMALRAFAIGKSCNQAKDGLGSGHSTTSRSAVEAIYKDLQGKCSGDLPTDRVMQVRVNQYLVEAGWKP
jgi:hypothetical protein